MGKQEFERWFESIEEEDRARKLASESPTPATLAALEAARREREDARRAL